MSVFGEWDDADDAAQVGSDPEPNWHACICGAEYRSRRAALRCCGGRL